MKKNKPSIELCNNNPQPLLSFKSSEIILFSNNFTNFVFNISFAGRMTGFDESVFNVKSIIHCLRDVLQQLSYFSFASE